MASVPSRGARPTARQLVARIVEDPGLAAAVQSLPPPTLGRLIDHVGLEDAGELVALASTAQLTAVFDEDLWRSRAPGVDESFDDQRFGVWLEILLEVGERFAARKLVDMPEDLVTLGLHRRVLVIDIDALAVEMAERGEGDDEAEMLEKALEGTLHVELDRWRIIARQPEGWDAVAGVLLAVDELDHDFLDRLLERLAHLSTRDIDDRGGLTEALTGEETLAADAAADREDRRARAGFIAPSQAAAFLGLARRDGAGGPERDPIARAYFRELAREPGRPPRSAPAAAAPGDRAPAAGAPSLVEILEHAEVIEPRAPRLAGRQAPPETRFRRLLRELAASDPDAYARRAEELGFLANLLVVGVAAGGRPLRPLEAAEVALAVCDRGLDSLGEQASADRLFRAGWKSLDDERAFVAGIVAALDAGG